MGRASSRNKRKTDYETNKAIPDKNFIPVLEVKKQMKIHISLYGDWPEAHP